MIPTKKIVLSASRRTDIPAFYMEWFMQGINLGYFEVINPFNGKVATVNAVPENVHAIVFWSKNFGPFIDGCYGDILQKSGYNLFFNFTINSESDSLEPFVPPLKERFCQLEYLCNRFSAKCLNLRFDPICFYQNQQGRTENNLNDFPEILEKAHECGVQRIITSFMDYYPKIKRRIRSIRGFAFIEPGLDKKMEILCSMEKQVKEKNIKLMTCCEKDLISELPESSEIKPSSCIDNDLLMQIFGGDISIEKDSGQRIKAGCGCKVSKDVGSYSIHPCRHGCLFCYANPSTQLESLNP